MSFAQDLVRRVFALSAVVLLSIPLWSLAAVNDAPWLIGALVVFLATMSIARPPAGLLALALVLPLSFGISAAIGSRLTAVQVAECFVLAFVVGGAVRRVLDGRLFTESRLAMPALALAFVVVSSGLCAVVSRFSGVQAAVAELWRSATTYFGSPGAADVLQPTLHWLEFAALAPLVELAVRQRPRWRTVALVAWLGASSAVAGQTLLAEMTVRGDERFQGAIDLLAGPRFSPVSADVNAVGSLFALLVVTAVVFGLLSRHRIAMAIASSFLVVALFGTQSRAALGAVSCVLGFLSARALVRADRPVLAGLVVLILVAGSAGVSSLSRPAHVSVDEVLNSRVELGKIAVEITQQAPVFGVGLGQFQGASHNNFLQVLAELGVVGLVSFLWVLWAALRPTETDVDARPARAAVAAGLVTFLLSAMLGHPLLIYEVAAAAFLAVGLAAGMAPVPERRASITGRWLSWGLIATVLLFLPWRISAILAPHTPQVAGAGPVQGEIDGVAYRVADQQSRWTIRAHTRTVVALMRWDPAGATDCRVRLVVRDRPADEVSLSAVVWVPVRFAIPPAGRPDTPPEVEFHVSSPSCRLWVGTITAMR